MKHLKLFILVATIIIGSCSHSQNINKTPALGGVLKEVYKDAFLIGAAVNPAITSGTDKASQDIVIGHFNSITVENVMKAALINPDREFIIMDRQMSLLRLVKSIKCLLLAIPWFGTTNAPHGFLPIVPESQIPKKNR
jgi:hypothetical protein